MTTESFELTPLNQGEGPKPVAPPKERNRRNRTTLDVLHIGGDKVKIWYEYKTKQIFFHAVGYKGTSSASLTDLCDKVLEQSKLPL